MKRLFLMMVALCGLSLAALPSSAGIIPIPSLSLTTSSNLSNLTVGQTVTFNVNLAGLAPGTALNFLAATIQFDSTILGTPTNIQGGAILPNPLADPSDFSSTALPGLMDAAFVTGGPFSKMIGTNGVFFTFDLMALAPGSGTIGFSDDSGDLLLNANAQGIPFTPATSPALNYTVKAAVIGGGGGAVPLPASVWGAMILLAWLGLAAMHRRGSMVVA